jgi:hypothetical protein
VRATAVEITVMAMAAPRMQAFMTETFLVLHLTQPGGHAGMDIQANRAGPYPGSSPGNAYLRAEVRQTAADRDADTHGPPGTYRVEVTGRSRRQSVTGCGDLRAQRPGTPGPVAPAAGPATHGNQADLSG